jgi:hypothetical protein
VRKPVDAEIHHLYVTVLLNQDIAGLEIPVDDATTVSGVQGICDLQAQLQSFLDGQGPRIGPPSMCSITK